MLKAESLKRGIYAVRQADVVKKFEAGRDSFVKLGCFLDMDCRLWEFCVRFQDIKIVNHTNRMVHGASSR